MNYHTLPCGTVIPLEGIEAWVRGSENDTWRKRTIVSCVNGCAIATTGDNIMDWKCYSLTDPTKSKRRLVTPMELLGKFLHTDGRTSLVIEEEDGVVRTKNHNYTVAFLAEHDFAYSDTPTSELKSFWVEEV